MSINTYDIGDQTILRGTFTNSDGEVTDPTTVQVLVRTPAGTETTYDGDDITRDSEGIYSFEYQMTERGTYHYRWIGSGALVCAGEGYLKVKPSNFTTPLP
jgi:hypothetical protein